MSRKPACDDTALMRIRSMGALPLVFLLAHVLTLRIHAASLVLSEFMASNHHTLADGNGNFPDWIEIYNSGDLPMDLANWRLTDNPANLSLWTFPGVTLQPRSFLVVFASGAGAPTPKDVCTRISNSRATAAF